MSAVDNPDAKPTSTSFGSLEKALPCLE